jgi:hypothetical protein
MSETLEGSAGNVKATATLFATIYGSSLPLLSHGNVTSGKDFNACPEALQRSKGKRASMTV